MKNKFDELTKTLAQSVTRRGTLKKLGIGLAGMALACLGLNRSADAAPGNCRNNKDCAHLGPGAVCCDLGFGGKVCAVSKSECLRGQPQFP